MRTCRNCGESEHVWRGLCAGCRERVPDRRSGLRETRRQRAKRPDLEPLHHPHWVPRG
jgi:hypothetical protein